MDAKDFLDCTLFVLVVMLYFITGAFTAGKLCKNFSYHSTLLKIVITLFFPIFSFFDMCKTVFNYFYNLGVVSNKKE